MKATKTVTTAKGNVIINEGDILIKVTIGADTNQNVNEILKKELFEKIRNLSFNEYLGEYQEPSSPGVATENKQTYRIITYVEKT